MKPASAFIACKECSRLEASREALVGRLVATTQAMVLLAGTNKPLAFAKHQKECDTIKHDLEAIKLRIATHRQQPH